jgi:hypothetical protein
VKLPKHILEEMISEAKSDEVGLWFILSRLRDELDITDPKLLKDLTLQTIAELLHTGEVAAGWYKPDRTGVERWNMPLPDILSRISSEWERLGREPNIGEIVIFVEAADSKC